MGNTLLLSDAHREPSLTEKHSRILKFQLVTLSWLTNLKAVLTAIEENFPVRKSRVALLETRLTVNIDMFRLGRFITKRAELAMHLGEPFRQSLLKQSLLGDL